jgi:hypothetical protein
MKALAIAASLIFFGWPCIAASADNKRPTVKITAPTSSSTFATKTSPLGLGGTASDNVGVTQVTWSSSRGGSGTATGTANWLVNGIALQTGANVLTVTARDAAGNTGTNALTVTYDPTPPTVAITTPTAAATFTTTTSPIALGGTAADNIAVTQVTWSNDRGGSGTASGTTNWSASAIALQSGSNVLTVTARDGAGNTGVATLTVTYTPSSGLVAAYAFDEGAGTTSADASGNGYTATLVGGPSWVAGQFGSALSFNGTSSYAATGLTTNLPNWTISAWVRSPAAPTSGPASGPIHREANYQINWNHTSAAFQGAAGVEVSGSWYPASFGALAANTWYYVAASYDGETLKTYTNGVLVTSNTAPSGAPNAEPTALTIGRHSALNQFFQGIVDNVRIYNRALSPTEIQSDMNTPVGGTSSSDTTPPSVIITSPTTGATFSTSTSPIALGGTAADNVGVTQVTWSNNQGGSGTAIGTASWSVNSIALQPGSNVLTVTAHDAAGNSGTATLTVTYTAPDTIGPALAITSHSNNQTVNSSPVTVAGTASDAGLGSSGIASVTVNGTAAAGGTAVGSGTANWSQTLTLSPGSNIVTVVAKDNSPAQNATTVQITILYDPTPPTVAITTPTTAATFTTTTSPIALGGTAADNIAVTQVTWSNDRGGSGTASGTTNWSASAIALQSGSNVLTVTARDGAGNTGVATLTVTYTPSSGLVAAYAFDEGAGTTSADASGNGYTATLVGGPSWVAGQFGSALSFNGTSSYAATGLTTNLPNWTISAWVRSPAAPTSGPASGPIHREANYQINWNHTSAAFQGAAGVEVSGSWYPASFGALAANTWYYVAASYDGETLKTYTNGVLVTSNTAPSGAPNAEPTALTIGRHSALNQFFQGIVDNVRIYNRALSPTEIQSDMNTPVGGTSSSDTTPPSVIITSPTTGAIVSGNITVTATASDNVGVVGVRFLLDGVPLAPEITTPPYSISWNTLSAADGSHVLSAVARDAANNQTTSTIGVTVLNGGASVQGQWSVPFNLPIRDVHMVLLRTGDVLMWDAFESGHLAYLWNSSTGGLTYVPAADNIFCSGPALMANGNVLVAGGHSAAGVGIPDANRFDPLTRTWSSLAPMAFQRWYPTATTLSDGRVLVVSGATTCITCIGDVPELYDPTANTWTQLGGAQLNMPLYPHMFVLPDGGVLYASSTEGTIQTQALNIGTQTWTMIDPVAVAGGSSAMYLPGVILKSGSPGAPGRIPVATSLNTAYGLDMTQPNPAWRQVGSMAFGRTFHSLTILPDGNVLATGGSVTNDPASQAVYAAEMWSPLTETWSVMSSMQMARTYHETALLLPDGRVLVGGGGGCCGAPDQYNAEIFSPPYLFKGARPAITSVSPQVAYGSQFVVGTLDAASIASVALIRLGADTHQFNRDQRYLPLTFTVVGNELNVTMPTNINLAPPGDYMLFLVSGNGVPSVASMVTVH